METKVVFVSLIKNKKHEGYLGHEGLETSHFYQWFTLHLICQTLNIYKN